MDVLKRNSGNQGRRRAGIDPSLAILVTVGLIVAGVTLPVANSLDSAALCFAPLFSFVLLYLAVPFLVRWMR